MSLQTGCVFHVTGLFPLAIPALYLDEKGMFKAACHNAAVGCPEFQKCLVRPYPISNCLQKSWKSGPESIVF